MLNILMVLALLLVGVAWFLYKRNRNAYLKKEYERGLSDGENQLFARSHTDAYQAGYSAGLPSELKEKLDDLDKQLA